MLIYELGTNLRKIESFDKNIDTVVVASPQEADKLLHKLDMKNAASHDLSLIHYCKAEVHHKYLEISMCIPDLEDVKGPKHGLQAYINPKTIVFVDGSQFVKEVIDHVREDQNDQGQTRERFLFDFFVEVLKNDSANLEEKEMAIMDLEDRVIDGVVEDFQSENVSIRKELLALRNYYEGMSEMVKEIWENDNDFFSYENLNYFEIISARTDRFLNRTEHQIEYLSEIRVTYMEILNDKQNSTMNYLTIISTIFLPLTLITGWFGMNFENMPELANGYPVVVAVCIVIVLAIIIIFKKKKLL